MEDRAADVGGDVIPTVDMSCSSSCSCPESHATITRIELIPQKQIWCVSQKRQVTRIGILQSTKSVESVVFRGA
jgi:hypothetical protein